MEEKSTKGHSFLSVVLSIVLVCLGVFGIVYMLVDTSDQKTIQTLSYNRKSDADRIYETVVNEWIRNIKNTIDNHQGNISEYIDGWDTLTNEQQQAVIDMISTSNYRGKIAKVLDKMDNIIPVVFSENFSCLNGTFHINEDTSVVLERNAESQAILEQYLCPKCEGRGKTVSPRSNCTACNGKGMIHIKCAKYDSELGWEDYNMPCDKCPLVSCNLCEGYKYCSIISIKEWKGK